VDKWENRPLFALDADVTVYWPDVRPCYDWKEQEEVEAETQKRIASREIRSI